MTEENYLYRTSPLMLRNQFPGFGNWHIPIIPKARFSDEELEGLRLIGLHDKRQIRKPVLHQIHSKDAGPLLKKEFSGKGPAILLD